MLVIWRVCCPELGLGSIRCVQVPERPPRPTEMQGPTWLCVPTGDCHLNKKESLETGVGVPTAVHVRCPTVCDGSRQWEEKNWRAAAWFRDDAGFLYASIF